MSDLLEVNLSQTTQDIWAAMLGLELAPDHELDRHDPTERVVTGVVQITGDWEGAVTVQTSERFATRAAGLLFMMDDGEVSDEEVIDTIGELANVVGGNVKSALSGQLQLSLPAVTSGRDYQIQIAGTAVVERLALDCDGELVVVAILQRQTSAG